MSGKYLSRENKGHEHFARQVQRCKYNESLEASAMGLYSDHIAYITLRHLKTLLVSSLVISVIQ